MQACACIFYMKASVSERRPKAESSRAKTEEKSFFFCLLHNIYIMHKNNGAKLDVQRHYLNKIVLWHDSIGENHLILLKLLPDIGMFIYECAVDCMKGRY